MVGGGFPPGGAHLNSTGARRLTSLFWGDVLNFRFKTEEQSYKNKLGQYIRVGTDTIFRYYRKDDTLE